MSKEIEIVVAYVDPNTEQIIRLKTPILLPVPKVLSKEILDLSSLFTSGTEIKLITQLTSYSGCLIITQNNILIEKIP